MLPFAGPVSGFAATPPADLDRLQEGVEPLMAGRPVVFHKSVGAGGSGSSGGGESNPTSFIRTHTLALPGIEGGDKVAWIAYDNYYRPVPLTPGQITTVHFGSSDPANVRILFQGKQYPLQQHAPRKQGALVVELSDAPPELPPELAALPPKPVTTAADPEDPGEKTFAFENPPK